MANSWPIVFEPDDKIGSFDQSVVGFNVDQFEGEHTLIVWGAPENRRAKTGEQRAQRGKYVKVQWGLLMRVIRVVGLSV